MRWRLGSLFLTFASLATFAASSCEPPAADIDRDPAHVSPRDPHTPTPSAIPSIDPTPLRDPFKAPGADGGVGAAIDPAHAAVDASAG